MPNIIDRIKLRPKIINYTTGKWWLSYIGGRFFDASITSEQQNIFETLKKDDLVLDIGANIGKYTFAAALHGAEVHAFEPNPIAFAKLASVMRHWPCVHLHAAAASTNSGSAPLYLHTQNNKDPLKFSTASSLMINKGNICDEYAEIVRTIDLATFVLDQPKKIKLLKMDVEGAEVEIIPHLVDTGAIENIDTLLIELHDKKNPSLREPTSALRELAKQSTSTRFFLDWH